MKKIISFFFVSLSFLFLTTSQILAISGPVNPFSFNATTGDQSGTVKITWYDDGYLTKKYNLLFGTSADNFEYSAIDIYHQAGQSNEFVVTQLNPNQTYYFKLDAFSGGSYFTSGPISATAGNGKTSIVQYSTSSSSALSSSSSFNFYLTYGSKSGTINVNFTDNETADKYDIVYGTTAGDYIYGAHSISFTQNSTNSFPINFLTPGKTYYFALVAERDNSIVYWSSPLRITTR